MHDWKYIGSDVKFDEFGLPHYNSNRWECANCGTKAISKKSPSPETKISYKTKRNHSQSFTCEELVIEKVMRV